MLRLTRPALAGLLALLWSGVASATPVTYDIVNLVQTGTGLVALGITTMASHTAGTGDITVSGGQITSGSASGADWKMNIAIAALSASVDIDFTSQDISTISSSGGNVTAVGSTANTTCGGTGSAFVCGSVPVGANVGFTWPVADDGLLNPETATIANFAGSDTNFSFDVLVYSNLDQGANGTVEVTQTWHFASVVPEPGTVLLLGMGLIGLATSGRRRA